MLLIYILFIPFLLFYRHENEPQVRLRYSSQGTESNLVSVQRSTSLPAPFLSTQSSLVPADAQLSGSTNLSTPPFAHRSHSPQMPDDSIVEPQAQLLVNSVENPQSDEAGRKLKFRIQLVSYLCHFKSFVYFYWYLYRGYSCNGWGLWRFFCN